MSPKQIIFKLETKVGAAIELIRVLKQKNKFLTDEKELAQKKYRDYESSAQSQLDSYKERVDSSEEKILELEKLVDSAQKEQSNLEKSVTSALINFDTVEELKNSDNLSTISTNTESAAAIKDNVAVKENVKPTSKESKKTTITKAEVAKVPNVGAIENSTIEEIKIEDTNIVDDFEDVYQGEDQEKDEESFEIFP